MKYHVENKLTTQVHRSDWVLNFKVRKLHKLFLAPFWASFGVILGQFWGNFGGAVNNR